MKKNNLFILAIIVSIALLFLYARFVINHEKPYDALFFMDRIYYITNEPVDVHSIGEEIGEVKVKTEKDIIPSDNNYSNCLRVGTKIFSFENSVENAEIVVQNNRDDVDVRDNNIHNKSEYVKAYVIHKTY